MQRRGQTTSPVKPRSGAKPTTVVVVIVVVIVVVVVVVVTTVVVAVGRRSSVQFTTSTSVEYVKEEALT